MEEKEFLKQMENLNVPDINPAEHQNSVKMAIMNAERSAALGVWLVVVPCYFLLCVLMYYYFHIHVGWFGAMFTLMASLEKTPYIDFIGPIVLFVLPIICIVINVLAILHVQVKTVGPVQSKVREFSFTIRVKPLNILLILISLAVIFVFINYVMTENISIKN
jgi:lantibiotic transport system permease protein